MIVRLYTTLKDKIGASRVQVEADTAAQAVARLREKYADIVNATLVDAEGVVRNHFTLTLNSRILDPHKLDVPLKDGDMLHIFPPIAGGTCRHPRASGGLAPVFISRNWILTARAEMPHGSGPLARE